MKKYTVRIKMIISEIELTELEKCLIRFSYSYLEINKILHKTK